MDWVHRSWWSPSIMQRVHLSISGGLLRSAICLVTWRTDGLQLLYKEDHSVTIHLHPLKLCPQDGLSMCNQLGRKTGLFVGILFSNSGSRGNKSGPQSTTRESNVNGWVIAQRTISGNEDHSCYYYQRTVQIVLQALNAFHEMFICGWPGPPTSLTSFAYELSEFGQVIKRFSIH